jgi:Fic family protein
VITFERTYYTELESTFNRLFDKLAKLNAKRPLPAVVLFNIREALTIEWTYNSNKIEGNTLTLRETQMVLQEGITVKGKTLREHFEAKNHEIAINKLFSMVHDDYPLNSDAILYLHSLVMRTIEEDFAGRYRNASVRISGANFIPPNALKVYELVEELILFVNENSMQLNVIELATFFHHRLVWIHPFFDGNGRTVRLAMNLILMQKGFPPAIILSNDRKKYYEALNLANRGKLDKLMLLMCQAVERSLNIYLQALPDNPYEYREISSLLEESQMPYGQEYISFLARNGKIDAYKEGRNWLTHKTAIENYFNRKK